MTLTENRVPVPEAAPGQDSGGKSTGERRRGLLTGLGVAVLVAVLAQVPLIRNRIFYYWDDSAAAFLPDWHYIGEQLRAGIWPVMSPEMWMGGNIAGESMMSLFNPVMLANYLAVSAIPSLALSATLVKTEFLVLLALGVYLLARDFGANRAAAAAVAVALPFSGYTLYFDASAWAGGLICFAWLPIVWWSLRRFAYGRMNPIVPIVLGFLAMTVGNPYGALGVMVILAAVAVELALQKHWKRFGWLVVVGGIIGLSTLVVFLPLAGSSAVTWRTDQGVLNTGFLVPNLGDLFAMSAPTFQPQYRVFGSEILSFPMAYLAWFIVPLAPWLRWSALRERVRERSSLIVFAGVYLLFLFGPSTLWLFRWPARLTEYAYLPIAIAMAIVLTKGLDTSRAKAKAIASAIIVLVGAYLSWASTPQHVRWHALATVVVLLLVAAAVKYRERFFGTVLVLGTAVLLVLQTQLYTGNYNITPWRFPHDVAAMRDNFDDRYQGNTLQVVDLGEINEHAELVPDGAWRDVMLTNAIHTAGVDALNSYTGIGNVKFAAALCMNYYGATCPAAFDALWRPVDSERVLLADALRLRTVVVENGIIEDREAAQAQARAGGPKPNQAEVAPGWSVAERTKLVTVYKRDTPLPFGDGRLSFAGNGIRVTSDVKVGENGMDTRYEGKGGKLIFAALAWPGYKATVDGKEVEVKQGPAGLIELDVPAPANGGSKVELRFTPPGYGFGIPLMAGTLVLGVLFSIGWAVMGVRRRRREAATPAE
ncbi:hypothetical protein JOD54_001377 [Actinokineospora baliensis]|uniref:hypothetical protein n=1 Tax=Actinokineospora baliensis TaxID=547056 RepID=UPI0019585AE5|nr:hypothetical protein [Actinokineospora baliensis]MBM7771173.1 hypothetical protein [Actinokineospora baliensis]